MKLRHARIRDAKAISGLVNYYAERGRMLHRSLESTYTSLRDFLVLEDDDGEIAGCCAISIFWADLAELKSLAVSPDYRGRGLGRRLVSAAKRDAKKIGVQKIFALTYEKEFFLKQGFKEIDRDTLPEKVWRECFACPKEDCCDEIAMLLRLDRRKKRD